MVKAHTGTPKHADERPHAPRPLRYRAARVCATPWLCIAVCTACANYQDVPASWHTVGDGNADSNHPVLASKSSGCWYELVRARVTVPRPHAGARRCSPSLVLNEDARKNTTGSWWRGVTAAVRSGMTRSVFCRSVRLVTTHSLSGAKGCGSTLTTRPESRAPVPRHVVQTRSNPARHTVVIRSRHGKAHSCCQIQTRQGTRFVSAVAHRGSSEHKTLLISLWKCRRTQPVLPASRCRVDAIAWLAHATRFTVSRRVAAIGPAPTNGSPQPQMQCP